MTIFSGGTLGAPPGPSPFESSPPRGSTALSVDTSGFGLTQGLFLSAAPPATDRLDEFLFAPLAAATPGPFGCCDCGTWDWETLPTLCLEIPAFDCFAPPSLFTPPGPPEDDEPPEDEDVDEGFTAPEEEDEEEVSSFRCFFLFTSSTSPEPSKVLLLSASVVEVPVVLGNGLFRPPGPEFSLPVASLDFESLCSNSSSDLNPSRSGLKS